MHEKILKRRMQAMAENERKMIEKRGWIAHAVFSEDGVRANHHTHGLEESCGHPDFQIALNVPPRMSHAIFTGLAEEIKKGKRYGEGRHGDVIEEFDVEMLFFKECGRKVLRVIFPDPSGKFPEDEGCEENYKTQIEPAES